VKITVDLTFITIVFWKILRRSKIFRIWYKRFLNELLFDLQDDLDPDLIKKKYLKKLEKAKTL